MIKNIVLKSFVFLGPIGNLIPVGGDLYSLRFFYLLLPIGIVTFLFGMQRNFSFFRRIFILLPLLFYMALSAFTNGAITGYENIDNENPIIRFCLFVSLLLFTLCGACVVSGYREEKKESLIYLYISGYIVSLLVGYVMFCGYYLNVFSIDDIEPFHVLLQFAYGILRFSPGSYPNEYGIVSSFVVSVFTLMIINSKKYQLSKMNKILLYILFVLAFIALFLATTRAAYLSYILANFYLCFKGTNLIHALKRIICVSMFFIGVFLLCQIYFMDMIDILIKGYEAISDQDASAYQRFYAWDKAYGDFLDSWLFGLGFGACNYIHNVYLQFLFELGIAGGVLLLGTFVVFFLKEKWSFYGDSFFDNVRNIGLIHVCWFALSNHNLNHHLTWFVFLLLLVSKTSKNKTNSGKHHA